MTLITVPVMVLAGLGMMLYMGAGAAKEPLLSGKSFSSDELKNAQEALQKAGLHEFTVEGQKILVPKAEIARYNAALVTNAGLPNRFGDDIEKALGGNPLLMGSDRQRQDLIDLAKSRELVKIIQEIPQIKAAAIVPHRSRPRGFSGEVKMTATLSVTPKPGSDVSTALNQSLQRAVAGAWGMSADDVTVLNTQTGDAFRQTDPDDPYSGAFVEQNRKLTSMYQKKIAESLSYIQNAVVTVNVELDPMLHSREQERRYDKSGFPYKSVEQTDTETANESRPGSEPGMAANQPRSVRPQSNANSTRNLEKSVVSTDSVPTRTTVTDRVVQGMTPKSVQVAVSIPRDYYRALAIKEGADEGDKPAFQARIASLQSQIEKEVSQKVAKLIPVSAANVADVINVSSYDSLDSPAISIPVPVTAQINDAVTQWGGPVGLALFALWAFWMLNRSMKRAPDAAAAATGQQPAVPGLAIASPTAEGQEDETPSEPTHRDRLQTLVKDNPEMAAAVLTRWLVPPK
jgi:flagellar M-ring protein FliF